MDTLKMYLKLSGTEASFDGTDESVVRDSARQHGRLEDLHLELVLVLPQPTHGVAAVTVPPREPLQLPMRRIVQLLQAVERYSEQGVQALLRLTTHSPICWSMMWLIWDSS